MDEASEKLENLNSINSMLLKDPVELRHQVNSLDLSKVSLESALTRWKMKNREFWAELTCLKDRTDQLHLERDLVSEFVAVQVGQQAEVVMKEIDGLRRERVEFETRLENLEIKMGEVMTEKVETEKVCGEKQSEIRALKDKSDLKFEIGNERDGSTRVSRERDALRAELDVQIEETNGLGLILIEEEKRGKRIQEEAGKLEMEYSRVLKDKDSIEKSLGESIQALEVLKRYTVDWVQLNIAEFGEIENAVKNKEIEFKNQDRQLQLLLNSFPEPRKKKNLFTMLSSVLL